MSLSLQVGRYTLEQNTIISYTVQLGRKKKSKLVTWHGESFTKLKPRPVADLGSFELCDWVYNCDLV
jgi:hypothetical protein